MILVADSGSTKTDWCLIDGSGEQHFLKSEGINPYFQQTEAIAEILRSSVSPAVDAGSLQAVYFYGAGCSSPSKCSIVADAFAQLFPGSSIFVDHDMLGAARALCGDEAGIAAILGTGSNSVLFDGKSIVEDVPSLGYVLGDEGSGGHIGKELIKQYVYGELKPATAEKFRAQYQLNVTDILESVYRKPLPNRYLASFCRFVGENLHSDDALTAIVHDAFDEFMKRHVSKYTNYQKVPFNCTGSVGYVFKDILLQVCSERGMTPGRIVQSPVQALAQYHSSK